MKPFVIIRAADFDAAELRQMAVDELRVQ